MTEDTGHEPQQVKHEPQQVEHEPEQVEHAPPLAEQGPLHAEHLALGATMTPFAGWSMPLRYTSDLAEHRAVRTAAGLFDLSHMGEIRVSGPGAGAALDRALVGHLSALAVGRARYTLLCAEDGGVLDDLIVYRTSDEDFLVVANAANADVVRAELLARCAGAGAVDVTDISLTTALLAVQGPAAADIVAQLVTDPAERATVTALRSYACTSARIAVADTPPPIATGPSACTPGISPTVAEAVRTRSGRPDVPSDADALTVPATVPVLVARTGYTGEDGFELYVDTDWAAGLWRALLAVGKPSGLVPAGLASRDSLRLEAGMPLYGHELDRTTTPHEAGLGRVVRLDKADADGTPLPFVGRDALAARAEAPPTRVLVGLRGTGRRAARQGYPVVVPESGAAVGQVTSGAPSPTLGHPIAMAYVSPEVSTEGTELAVDVRGRAEPVRVVPLPFYRRTTGT